MISGIRGCWMTSFRKWECSRLPAQHHKMTFDQASVCVQWEYREWKYQKMSEVGGLANRFSGVQSSSQSSKSLWSPSLKLSPSKACVSTTNTPRCSSGLKPVPKARDHGSMKANSIGYHVWRVSSRQSSSVPVTFSDGKPWLHGIQIVRRASKRTPGTGFYCWCMLSGVHAKTLTAGTSIRFARLTQCTRLHGSPKQGDSVWHKMLSG